MKKYKTERKRITLQLVACDLCLVFCYYILIMDSDLAAFQKLLKTCRRIVFFTGAGLSTESGIADYRSHGGQYSDYQPVSFQEFVEDETRRREYWRHKKELFASIREAKPNAGHRAIAGLEASGRLTGVITQNIDGLHALAGSRRLIELHGTNRECKCLSCAALEDFEVTYQRLLAGEESPRCKSCGGLLKPNTISFGQELEARSLYTAFEWATSCDLMVCAGSSLVVEPAASLPVQARQKGAALAILNRETTPLDPMASLVLHGELGELLAQAVA